MVTEVLKIDPENVDLTKVRQAARVIKKGGIVGLPTETVYGLAADSANRQAVDKLFRLKKRPKNKPLTMQIENISYLEQLECEVSPTAYQLISRFWPGPLTLVFKTKQQGTVGVRIPANNIARSLIAESQTALMVPSANLSGQPEAQTADQVLDVFSGAIDLLLDGGPTELGIASTVLDCSVSPHKVLRLGAISRKDIQNA